MKARRWRTTGAVVAATVCGLSAFSPLGGFAAESWSDYYTIEDIPVPEGVVAEVGGIDALEDGRIVVAFGRGEVYIHNPETGDWNLYAEGLHHPLGVVARSDREIIVSQRPEVTRLLDTDGDGVADFYQTITDDFGMSGNYHEFHFGGAEDAEGNLYISLGTASENAGVRYETRGGINRNSRRGRMYSAVPYRGWVMKISPDGKMEPFASGFRTPNGLGFDLEGRLFVTDNEGDWVGTSPVHHVEQGNFYGHVASLVWTEGWDKGVVLDLDPEYFRGIRTRPAVELTHGVLSNSPTQPRVDSTGGGFGPFAGQLFVGEMNHQHLIRVMLEEVAGRMQGAAVKFHEGNGIRRGNNRLTFAPEDSLWVGQTHRELNWLGATGIQRISWTGKTPMEVQAMHLTEDGFRVRFTLPVDPATASDPASYAVERYRYLYNEPYGSPQVGKAEVAVTDVEISADGREVKLVLDRLVQRHIHEFSFAHLRSAKGLSVSHPEVMYTLDHLLDGTDELPPPFHADDAFLDAAVAELLGGVAAANNHAGYTGSGFADWGPDNADGLARWTVQADEPGTYRLGFRYALESGNRPLRVVVNDEIVAERLDFPATGGWATWSTVTTDAIELKKGINVIELQQIDIRGANIDGVELLPAE